MSTLYAQDISDALRYSQDEIQGTARFRALSGAFGALGGDMSAVNINPASSAIFSQSHASFSLSNLSVDNSTGYFNGQTTTSNSDFDINQGGAAFVFASRNNSPWRKFSLGIAYDRTNNFDNNWNAFGTNTNNQSIDFYFLDYANGIPLQDINDFNYAELGNRFGYAHQQAFLGYESYIINPDDDSNPNNTTYFSSMGDGVFDHDYLYASTGFNGKIAFNFATQYRDNLYLGLNLNSHFIDYQRSTSLLEENINSESTVNFVQFDNNLSTRGSGFSFQLGGILKLSPEFRVGLTYDSPTWYKIEEETTQYIYTESDFGFDNAGSFDSVEIDPQIVNLLPSYRLQTPGKITGSLAYVFNNQGLISFDYSSKNYANTELKPNDEFVMPNEDIANLLRTAATYRLGGEYKVNQFSFRGGYRFEESPYVDGVTVGDLSGFSLGLGYSFGNTKLDLTYDRSERSFETPLYNIGLTDAAFIDRTNSNVTVSLSFNI